MKHNLRNSRGKFTMKKKLTVKKKQANMKKSGLSGFYSTYLAAKRLRKPSFMFNGKRYVGRNHAMYGWIYKKSGAKDPAPAPAKHNLRNSRGKFTMKKKPIAPGGKKKADGKDRKGTPPPSKRNEGAATTTKRPGGTKRAKA